MGFLTWCVAVVMGGGAVVLADFGAPVWVFVALALYLCTLGLPTTLATLATLSLVGAFPGIVVAISSLACASLAAQLLASFLLSRLAARSSACA